jgi:K+-sensing histidine kinase KdpD
MEWLAAEAAFKSKTEGGSTTNLVSNAEAFYYPVLSRKNEVIYMIGIKLSEAVKSDKEEMIFLRNFIDEIKPFLEKASDYSIP